MNRSHRIALTAAAASTLIAGAAGAIAIGPLGVPGPVAAEGLDTSQAGSSQPAASTALDQALSRLTSEAIGLQGEIAAARHRLDSVGAQAHGPAGIAGAASASPAPASSARQPAPTVHTRTGASSAAGHEDHEAKAVEDD
jgi:hypothetical protein